MKILFYNWVDYLDDEKRGGGVTVYQRNTIQAMRAKEDVSCTFLSSGISYDVLQKGTAMGTCQTRTHPRPRYPF